MGIEFGENSHILDEDERKKIDSFIIKAKLLGLGDFNINRFSGHLISYAGDARELILPECIKSISEGAFAGSEKLEYIKIPEGIKVLPTSVFKLCKSLERLDLPESLEVIGSLAFNKCYSLKELILGDNVWALLDDLYSCYGLEKIELPRKLLYNNIFKSKQRIKNAIKYRDTKYNKHGYFGSLSYRDFITEYKYTLSPIIIPVNLDFKTLDLSSVKALKFEDGIVEIPENTFYNLKSLETIEFPSSLRVINNGAFSKCPKIVNANLSSNIKVGEGCFRDSKGLLWFFKDELEVKSDGPTIDEKAYIIDNFIVSTVCRQGTSVDDSMLYHRIYDGIEFRLIKYVLSKMQFNSESLQEKELLEQRNYILDILKDVSYDPNRDVYIESINTDFSWLDKVIRACIIYKYKYLTN